MVYHILAMANKFNMKGLEDKAKKNLSNALVVIASTAKNHFVQSFRDGGFTDNSFKAWKKRKDSTYKKGKVRDTSGGTRSLTQKGRAILVKTGHLRQSVKVKGINKGSLQIVIGSDLPYARVHNDGLHSGRGHGFIMPKRKFIGNSSMLNKKIIVIIDKRIKSIFK